VPVSDFLDERMEAGWKPVPLKGGTASPLPAGWPRVRFGAHGVKCPTNMAIKCALTI
jgi:hypothetical protein